MNNLIIKRSQIAEAQITGTPAVGKKYPFIQIPNLARNNIVIYGFEAFTADQLAFTPSNNTVIPASANADVVITFVDDKNEERVYQMPLYTLISSLNGGFIKMVKPFIMNLTRCYIQLVDAGNVSENEVVALNLYYSIIGQD